LYISSLLEVFGCKFIEKECLCVDFRVGLLVCLSLVDEDAVGVFFKFGEILCKIGVIQTNSRIDIFLHSVRTAVIEFRACKFDENFLDKWRYFIKHFLEFINLLLLLINVILNFDPSLFIFRGIVQNSLLLLVVLLQLLIFCSEVLVDVN
jgi:hypothetical protein